MDTAIPIIYWTKWFNTNQWQDYTIDKCNLPYTCKITHDRTKVKDSSVLIFHASDMNDKNDMPPLLKNRAWVYHNAEPPKNTPNIIDQMQYSMTYRLDSDFPWGYLEEKSLLLAMEKPLVINKPKKKAPVAWIVSNCRASNYRHHYVKELVKWIDVDIYGHCMNNQVFPDNNTTTVDLISNYYFYLAIENSNCKDYVTEKLSNAYLAGVVPIVDGPSDYSHFIPNTRSVIRIDDFDTPKELATYLNTLIRDKLLYNEYLSFHKHGGLSNQFKNTLKAFEQGKCGLCTLAYHRYENMSLYYYPGKKIYLDNTCVLHKHYKNSSDFLLTVYTPIILIVLGISYFFLNKYKSRFRAYKKTATTDA